GRWMVSLVLNVITSVLTARTVLVPLKLGALALIVVVPLATPLAVAEAEVLPAGMKTGLATVPREGSTVLRVTFRPPGGAGSVSVTGNWMFVPGATRTLGGSTIWFWRTLIDALSWVCPAALAPTLVLPTFTPVTPNITVLLPT